MATCIFCGGAIAPYGEVDLCLVCGKFQPEPEEEDIDMMIEIIGHFQCENAEKHISHEWKDRNGSYFCEGKEE